MNRAETAGRAEAKTSLFRVENATRVTRARYFLSGRHETVQRPYKKAGDEIPVAAGCARWSETGRVLGAVAKASRVIAFARVPVSSTSAPPRARGASGRTSRPSQPTRVRCFPRRRKGNETPSAGHTRVRLGPRPRPPPRALAVHAPRVATHARREHGLPPVRPHCAAPAWREFDKYSWNKARTMRTTRLRIRAGFSRRRSPGNRSAPCRTKRVVYVLSREYLTG